MRKIINQTNDDQLVAEKILDIIKNNPEKVKYLTPYEFNDSNYYIRYEFYLGNSPNLIHIRTQNCGVFSGSIFGNNSNHKHVLLMGKPEYHIKCDSNTSKEIYEEILKLDPKSRVNFLKSLTH
jgi:hypothetical protein